MLRAGESDRVEWKGRGADKADIVAAAVCFANAEGGLILWGVSDKGLIEGTPFKKTDALRNAIYTGTAPSQLTEIQLLDAGAPIIAIWVSPAPSVVSTAGGGYTHRVGTDCLPMTPDRLVVRQIDMRQLDASAALTPYSEDALDPLEIERYRRALPDGNGGDKLASLPDGELVRAVGAVVPYQGQELVTVAGLLVFGLQERIRSLMPQHEVLYLRTSPDAGGDYARRLATSAPMLSIIDDVQREISAGSRTRILRLGPRDLEIPDYPERAVREAVVNALAHRHITLPGHIVITQTQHSLEIENPGGFPDGITPETVIRHAPVHRNRLLCEILDKVRYMERSGLGVDRIYLDQLRLGKQPPVYDASSHAVRLRLDASGFDEPYARFVISQEASGRGWGVDELLLTAYLRRMGPSDRSALAAVIQRGEEETQDLLLRLMGDLVDRFGGGAAARFGLSASVQEALGSPAAYTRERGLERDYQRSLVLQHARQFSAVTNREVRDLLQITMGQATRLLQGMESDGQLRQVGERRWARYLVVS